MTKILMCRPTYFDVTYDINPWMSDQQHTVDKLAAMCEWQLLRDWIVNLGGCDVEVMDGVDGLPDLVFTANAGFVNKNTAILTRFSKPERRPEENHYRAWFESRGYTVVQPTNDYEGEGDHLVDCFGKHWIGTGFRTNVLATYEIEDFLDTCVNTLMLMDKRWYHLDTCFCPLPGGEVMWYPYAFSKASRRRIRESFHTSIEVSLEDALQFCCNTLCVADHLFMPEHTMAHHQLKKLGYITHLLPMSQFLKAGGAVKCLSLDLHC